MTILAGTTMATAYFWPAPDLDSRTYPFVGQRSQASEPVFGQYNSATFLGAFDNRDSQVQIAFRTASPCLPAGLPTPAYDITFVTLTLTVVGIVGTPRYDPTQDDQATYPLVGRPAIPDPDPGRPIELFGAAFRNGYTGFEFGSTPTPGAPLFGESDEGYGPSAFGQGIRHIFPTDFAGQVDRDVSNNLDEVNAGAGAFNPVPFAVGTAALAPGAPIVPGTVFTFTIAPGPGGVPTDAIRYIRRALAGGQLGFVVATLLPASGDPGGGQGGEYVAFAMTENGSDAATLRLEVASPHPTCPGDIDCGSGTSIADFNVIATNFTRTGVGRAEGDLTGDGRVDIADFNVMASDFGCSP